MARALYPEEVEEMLRLAKDGMTISEIARVTKRSDTAVKKYVINREPPKQIKVGKKVPWQAHCEACDYAFRAKLNPKATKTVKGCELEIEDVKNCRLWRDNRRLMDVPEWVGVEDDLPQMMADGISITVRVRLINGGTADAYCDEDGKWFFTSGEPVPEKYPVIRWRSL